MLMVGTQPYRGVLMCIFGCHDDHSSGERRVSVVIGRESDNYSNLLTEGGAACGLTSFPIPR